MEVIASIMPVPRAMLMLTMRLLPFGADAKCSDFIACLRLAEFLRLGSGPRDTTLVPAAVTLLELLLNHTLTNSARQCSRCEVILSTTSVVTR